MNFKQRLVRYLMGIMIGIILSGFFFKDRLSLFTSWLPGNRIIDRLQQSSWLISGHDACVLSCHKLDVEKLKTALREAKVDFSNSQTHGPIKEYELSLFHAPNILDMRFSVNDSMASMIKLESALSCDCPE
jgi:hypothetical protein